MANKLIKGLGGAASGAAAGSAFGPIGTGIGGGLGFLGGLFGGGDPEMPVWTDVEFAKLQENFPEYAAQIQANKLAYGDLARRVAEEQQGPSVREQAQQQQYMDQISSAQAMGGNQGNPMANAMMADNQARTQAAMYDAAHQRALQSSMGLQQAGAGLASQYGNLGQLQNAAMQMNNQNLLSNAQGSYGHGMAGWEADRQQNQNDWQSLINLGGLAYQAHSNPYTNEKLFGGGLDGSGQGQSSMYNFQDTGMFGQPNKYSQGYQLGGLGGFNQPRLRY